METFKAVQSETFRRPPGGGWLVRSRENSLGPGKVIRRAGNEVTVEYFHSPGRQAQVELSASSLVRMSIEEQTRCYLYSEEQHRWMAGRVTEKYDDDYQVDLPDGRSVYVTEAAIYIRCSEVADPMETLLVHGHETAFFHKHRINFVRSVLRQRAAFHGLTALASAGIELYPHQVEIVRRVLEDPVQRYLLADEVGLGKTIEAGTLVRQYLIDEPGGQVVVAAPSALIPQWIGELMDRFQLSGANVRVLDVSRLAEASLGSVGLLVVDEAHHVAAAAFSENTALRAQYSALARAAHAAGRLLLLSATPASNHEREFLAMLHLLDPSTYRLDGLAEFRERVEKRQVIGRLLLAIQEDADPFVLERTAGRIADVLPTDAVLRKLNTDLLGSLSEGDEERGRQVVRQIRAHIAETYRIHRRMLRSRRDELGGVLAARVGGGDQAPTVLDVPDSRVLDAYRLIDDWRAYAVEQIDLGEPAIEESLSDRHIAALRLCQLMLDCAATSLPRLAAVAGARRREALGTADLLNEQEAATIAAPPTFPEERGILQGIASIAQAHEDKPDRADVLAMYLQSERQRVATKPPPKCAVFASDPRIARQVATRLAERLGRKAVASTTADHATLKDELARFRTDRDCFVLICDKRAEEGLNLQFADQLVLYDLPWSPNQLEQRIGRLDRIGRTRHVKTIVFRPAGDDDSIYAAWLALLRDQIRIFHESAAGLQFFLSARMPALEAALLRNGADGLRAVVSDLHAEIVAEKNRLREQSALDEIDASTEHASRFFASLDDVDAEADKMRAAFEGWACSVLDLRRRAGVHQNVASYGATKHTKVPRSLIRQALAPYLDKTCSFRRDVAVAAPGVSLVRIGHGLVDGLCRYIDWDDRGCTYAIWRWEPTWGASARADWMGFRLHYTVQADLRGYRKQLSAAGLASHAWHALQRRADAVFPPVLVPLFFDVNASEVTDPAVLDALKQPFAKATEGGRDYNLHKANLHVLAGVISPDHWDWACRNVRMASEACLCARQSFIDRSHTAVAEIERRAALETAQLKTRAAAALADGVPDSGSSSAEQDLVNHVLREAVQNPAVRLESVGFVVISGRKHPNLVDVE